MKKNASLLQQRLMPIIVVISISVATILGAACALGAITIPGADGSDGALNITEDTTIDLSQAVTGTWDDDNSANAGKGVYDAEKWAVVFKYTSVTVAEGATLSFTNHPSRAPIVWLVSGEVSIAGNVSLRGQNYQTPPALAEPGPGGFRGGTGYYSAGVSGAAGLGVGGGWMSYGGSYGTQGGSNVAPYGNPSVIPLIGGSGGGGDSNSAYGGGGGGGAILIACQNLTISGILYADGGSGISDNYLGRAWYSGGGSGGAIRVVCDVLSGAGTIRALAGGGYRVGGLGRIRLERVSVSDTQTVSPDPSVIPLATGDTAVLWPPAEAPQVKIVSISGQAAPADPRAEFGAVGADLVFPQTSSVDVEIETTNVEEASVVEVRGTPRSSGNATIVNASVSSVVSTDPLVVLWTASVPVGVGYSAVQVKVIRP